MQTQPAHSTFWFPHPYLRPLSLRTRAQGCDKPLGDRWRDSEMASLWGKIGPKLFKGVRLFSREHQIRRSMGVGVSGSHWKLCVSIHGTYTMHIYTEMCVYPHTPDSTACFWSESCGSALVFLPSVLDQSVFLQTDKALFQVQCTLLLLHCHQKLLMKCLIFLWGYLDLVDFPDGTFRSGTWNFPFAYLCYVKSVTEHT